MPGSELKLLFQLDQGYWVWILPVTKPQLIAPIRLREMLRAASDWKRDGLSSAREGIANVEIVALVTIRRKVPPQGAAPGPCHRCWMPNS